MTDIKIDSDAMNAIVAKAILEGIDDNQRQAIMEQAVKYLVTPPQSTGYGNRPRGTPLQEAFDLAVQSVVNEVAREVVGDNQELRAKLKTLVTEAMASALADPYGKLGEAIRRTVADVLAEVS